MNRPQGSNADQWHLFLSEHVSTRPNQVRGLEFVAVQIAEAIDEAGIKWQRGFPQKGGMYLVELHDGEHVVTPYQAERRWVEADQDWDNRTGWVCLTHSHSTVRAWAEIPKRQ